MVAAMAVLMDYEKVGGKVDRRVTVKVECWDD